MEFSLDGSKSKIIDLPIEPIDNIKSHQFDPLPIGMGVYYFPLDQGDSEDAILQWKKSIFNISTTSAFELEHQPKPLIHGKTFTG